ncbi:MAG: hypothetical protein ABI325_06925 [Ginsengibacter sp.]
MKKESIDPKKLKELLGKGLELTFIKLLKQKKAANGFFVFFQNGQIEKIKATDISL